MLLNEKSEEVENRKTNKNKKAHIKHLYLSKDDGITLMALVITIIVLLILARSFIKYGI